ncbi:MAG: hypothetical protein EAZ97_08130 [Bacteroidetes bacterium]|nr:MAG: hypothetical protein EAZ97_08130 [Bacteroidota bacterium]
MSKRFIILYIVLFLNILLLTYAYFFPEIPLYVNQDEPFILKFVKFDELLSTEEIIIPELNDKILDDQFTENQEDTSKQGNITFLSESEFLSAQTDKADQRNYGSSLNVQLPTNLDLNETNKLSNEEINGKRPLDNFFNALQNERNTKTVRVVHYGDSQIEGDRVTDIIRANLQASFGGSGLGFIPFTDKAWHLHLSRGASENWKRYNFYNQRMTNNDDYGISGNLYRYSGSHASLSFKLFQEVRYKSLYLFYGKAVDSSSVAIYDKGNKNKMVGRTVLPASNSPQWIKLNIPDSIRNFKIDFYSKSAKSPDFYGLWVEGDNKGVQVDNYGIRAHAGDGLSRMDSILLAQQIKLLNVKLIIVQYGANAAPYINSDAKCKYIEDVYYKVLTRLKGAAPDASILVVSVGDMARRSEGTLKSFPYISKFKEAQKRAANRAGLAFWDFYEVMGGQNSLLAWYKQKLAHTDGHLTAKGQKYVANEFAKTVLTEYQRFSLQKSKK